MDTRENISLSSPTVIVASRFCSPMSQQLIFPEKLKALDMGQRSLCAISSDGKLVFKTKASFPSEKHETVLIDAATGSALVSIQKKTSVSGSIWEVYAGKGDESKDLLFTVKRSSAHQIKTKLNVYLASNLTKEICDYRIEGSYKKKTCKVYKGISPTIVTQMSSEAKFASMHLKKDDIVLSIEPGMDSAFIAALIVVRHSVHFEGKKMVPIHADGIPEAIASTLPLLSVIAIS